MKQENYTHNIWFWVQFDFLSIFIQIVILFSYFLKCFYITAGILGILPTIRLVSCKVKIVKKENKN